MRPFLLAGLAGSIALSACVPTAEAPPPAPARPIPRPVRMPVATIPAPPPSSDWRDWALTPGTWRYAADPRGSRATFGQGGVPVLTLTCDRAGTVVRMVRGGTATTTLTVRTSTTARSLAAQTVAGGVEAVLPAGDRLLDAMGFSRGRFVVEGGPTPLVVPAWAEVLRVVEDCRG
ncbi:hypothetical protein ASE86_04070 [Sphingomonas sp. Leaf33]|uniref:hypothetical protein n=1 Tax=Sphingomonas sp. Leaf33 TaxID=1736215 RepID=UPI0006FED077|nr:hypothetical protein [Sphingomonas sp. Leaf33]KQN25424.1 hypothetical protein ASE86_04070 [Sphingomonas sp. Leaf33]